MARFYATMRGSRGEASRLGTPSSGISSHTRGWNIGGSVEMHARGDKDTVVMALTGGSNGFRGTGVEIAAFEESDNRVRFTVRLPGNREVRGYVGDDAVTIWEYDIEAEGGYRQVWPVK